MIVFRYLTIFAIPIFFATAAHYGTLTPRTEAQQNAIAWMNAASSADAEIRKSAYEALHTGALTTGFQWISYVFGASIILGSAATAFLIPVGSSADRALNLIATIVGGFCCAKLIGLMSMGWVEFGIWMAIGVVCALAIAKLRGALIT